MRKQEATFYLGVILENVIFWKGELLYSVHIIMNYEFIPLNDYVFFTKYKYIIKEKGIAFSDLFL